jgi:predicted GIY-YIG superfamily endonuclease
VNTAVGNDLWHVYIVRCADDSLYTGVAKNLDTRIAQHNAGGGAKYTRSRLPVELVYTESAPDRSAAQKREAQIKRLPAGGKRNLIASSRSLASAGLPLHR